jgi:hypothetical protein
MPEHIQQWFDMMEKVKNHLQRQAFEHMDNFRYAKLDDLEALKKFEERHKRGCCGSREEIIEDREGNLWVVGFNYGH